MRNSDRVHACPLAVLPETGRSPLDRARQPAEGGRTRLLLYAAARLVYLLSAFPPLLPLAARLNRLGHWLIAGAAPVSALVGSACFGACVFFLSGPMGSSKTGPDVPPGTDALRLASAW